LAYLDDDDMNIKRLWEIIRQYMKVSVTESRGYYKSKQHTP